MEEKNVGNRFKKGQSGNPGGKTKAHRAAEVKAAKIAANMRLRALASMQALLGEGKLSREDIDMLTSMGSLKLFKDSEDRGHGFPRQSVDNTSSDGSMQALFASISERGKTVNDRDE